MYIAVSGESMSHVAAQTYASALPPKRHAQIVIFPITSAMNCDCISLLRLGSIAGRYYFFFKAHVMLVVWALEFIFGNTIFVYCD